MRLSNGFYIAGITLSLLGLWYYWVLANRIDNPIKVSQGTKVKSPEQVAVSNVGTEDDLVVIYNRVPKTGSTSFVNVAYELCKKNRFHVLHVNISANMHVLSLPNQISFVRNVSSWTAMKPALYHGHMAYLDFSRYQVATQPLYINIIRRPLDRLVSYYYFLRYGDNFRPYLLRKKSGDKVTFDECVELQQADCDPKLMWLQIPFFCGHHAECWQPGSEWALNEAKHNLVNKYFLVGVTEQMQDFIALLEMSLPRLFNGSLSLYLNSNKSHLRQTNSKIDPNETTIARIQANEIWRMENEFYEFAVDQFKFVQKKLYVSTAAAAAAAGTGQKQRQSFMYEKVRPKAV